MDYNWYYNEKLIKKKSLKKIFFIAFIFSIVIPFVLGFNPFESKDYQDTLLSEFAQNIHDITGFANHEISFVIVLYAILFLIFFIITFFLIFVFIYIPYKIFYSIKTYNYVLNNYGIITFVFFKNGNKREKYLDWQQVKSYKIIKSRKEVLLYSGRNRLLKCLHFNKTIESDNIKKFIDDKINNSTKTL